MVIVNPANTNWNDNQRRGRYGVAFVQSLCAQAGAGFTPTAPDEDSDAIDAKIEFARASLPVQIKCTGKFKVGENNATLDLEEAWVAKWRERYVPYVYVIMVKVPKHVPDWIDHGGGDRTLHNAVAFAARFDPATHTGALTFTQADRMSTRSIYEWRDELDEFYQGLLGGGAA